MNTHEENLLVFTFVGKKKAETKQIKKSTFNASLKKIKPIEETLAFWQFNDLCHCPVL